jgi:CTD nuclear envelope phosphatase 1
MNSLNIISSRVIGQNTSSSPVRPRSRSQGEILSAPQRDEFPRGRSFSDQQLSSDEFRDKDLLLAKDELSPEPFAIADVTDEKTPLLEDEQARENETPPPSSRLRLLAKRIVDALTESLRVILSTLAAPGVYIMTCFHDDDGRYSPLMPVKRMHRAIGRRKASNSTAQAVGLSNANDTDSEKKKSRRSPPSKLKRSPSAESMSSTTSDSEPERRRSTRRQHTNESGSTRSRSNISTSSEDPTPARRSIRIKLHNEDAKRNKPHKSTQPDPNGSDQTPPDLTIANIKSPIAPPSSSSHKITKYPHAPLPPRPLIPRRQPSYSSPIPPQTPKSLSQKTLVIDLDETLIHSLAKGGRMSSGHMVEVKLNTPVGLGGGATLGPQHPILYYVHKRPHCDDFLRKVCKWYKLVVFTASVQEYADPVIDWLEQERKFFVGRYYRQHCTFRNGAYIKDLSSIEPDLSKVMILDNSPMSYIFHEGTLSYVYCSRAPSLAGDF